MRHPKHKEKFPSSLLHRWNPFTKIWEWWDLNEDFRGDVWRTTIRKPRRVYKDEVVSFEDTWCEPIEMEN